MTQANQVRPLPTVREYAAMAVGERPSQGLQHGGRAMEGQSDQTDLAKLER